MTLDDLFLGIEEDLGGECPHLKLSCQVPIFIDLQNLDQDAPREEPMMVAALAVEAAAAFIAGQFFSLWAAALLAGSAGLAWGTAKFGFDALLQDVVHPDRRGSAFTRAETLFQLAWVVGAVLPVAVSVPAEVGLAVAGVTALAAQTVFVSRLLIEPRSR